MKNKEASFFNTVTSNSSEKCYSTEGAHAQDPRDVRNESTHTCARARTQAPNELMNYPWEAHEYRPKEEYLSLCPSLSLPLFLSLNLT